ncbi:MAG TPA: cell division protein ZapA [Rhodanobacteraceae bacterium]|nr:cell division protein ZapA [Rhodanobacteraceae bacterium]
MAETNVAVTVKLLDREFLVGCKPDERAGLLAAVGCLDHKMREIRHASRSPGYDRVAVLAALDITHDLLLLQRTQNSAADAIGGRLALLRRKLEAALDNPVE